MGTQRDVGGREGRYRRKIELGRREEEIGWGKIQRREREGRNMEDGQMERRRT
jgi:hypothetical protein